MKTLDRELLEEAIRRITVAVHPEAIYLYGSHAYGQPDDDSDVDMFVVVGDTSILTRQIAIDAYRALRGLFLPAEIKVACRSEFERRGKWLNSIERVVKEKGVLLYGSRTG